MGKKNIIFGGFFLVDVLFYYQKIQSWVFSHKSISLEFLLGIPPPSMTL